MWARLFGCMSLASIAGCGDDGAAGGAGSTGTGSLPDGVVAADVGELLHVAVDGGKVYFQTKALEYAVVEDDGPRRIERSALGPAGFAVRAGVVYYARNLFIARFDGTNNETEWRNIIAIATEVDDDFLYIANCEGVGRLPLGGDVIEGLVPGCFVSVGASNTRVWAQNEQVAFAVPKSGGEPLDVVALTGQKPAKLIGTDETGAYFPSDDAFPLLRVDDDGTLVTLQGDGEHVSLVDDIAPNSRYRVARRGADAYVLARRAPGEAEGVVLRVPLDGSAAGVFATFRAKLPTLAIDDAYVYYVDAGSIVRRPIP